MKRFRIRTLMGLVLLVAVGLALVARPTPIGNAVAFTASLFAVLVAVIGAMTARGRVRARCLGFMTLGGGYLLLSLGPWCEKNVRPHLATTALIDRAYTVMGIGGDQVTSVYHTFVTSQDQAVPSRGELFVSAFPPRAGRSLSDFRRLSHSFLAILLGAVGAFIADRFARRSNVRTTDQPPSTGSGTERGPSAETIPSASSIV